MNKMFAFPYFLASYLIAIIKNLTLKCKKIASINQLIMKMMSSLILLT